MIENPFFSESKSKFDLNPEDNNLTDFVEYCIDPNNYLDSGDDVEFRRNKKTLSLLGNNYKM